MRASTWGRRRHSAGIAVAVVALVAGGCTAVLDDPDAGPEEAVVADLAEERPATVIWFLPQAGDARRDNAEDALYRLLDDGSSGSCTAAADLVADPEAPFATGPRGAATYLAGAHLCLGDRAPAADAFGDARRADWDGPVDGVTAGRTCRVWAQVARLLLERELPCTLRRATAPAPAQAAEAA